MALYKADAEGYAAGAGCMNTIAGSQDDKIMTHAGEDGTDYRRLFDDVISSTIRQALRIAVSDPALAVAGAKILFRQKKAARVRQGNERQGILVPPVMMLSMTSRCNLACRGCYMHAQHRHSAPDMTAEELKDLVGQAAELGVSVIVFAGGEPMIRFGEIMDLARLYPHILFAFFTNGLLIDDAKAGMIAGQRNIVPVISFEGFRDDTDMRRGSGVYDRLLSVCSMLKERKVFFGCSVTVTRNNFDRVLDETFLRQMMDSGIRVFVYVEYVPIEPGTGDLVLAPDQHEAMNRLLYEYSDKHPALFIGFPGDEDFYGGCLAAGRGFIHVSPSGDLEPCPAAPFSDANLKKIPLKEALRSGFLERIREHHDILDETNGGCALWANREWTAMLLEESRHPDACRE